MPELDREVGYHSKIQSRDVLVVIDAVELELHDDLLGRHFISCSG